MDNNYGSENFDQERFGELSDQGSSILEMAKHVASRLFGLQRNFQHPVLNHQRQLEFLYSNLKEKADKDLLVELMAQRVLGFKKVKLSTNNPELLARKEQVRKLKSMDESPETDAGNWNLDLFNLSSIGYNAKLYFTVSGIVVDFLLEQYAYKLNGKTMIQSEEGDIVLDCGGCWGDTAIYFATKVGPSGHVFSFEFIPKNIRIHQKNINLNPHLVNQITLVSNPVWSASDIDVYFKDHGPGSKVSFEKWDESDGLSTTISIDDFVTRNQIDRVDFIKMDIEGAEPSALEGARETIIRFKPKLAIAIYHSLDDFVNIPKWILDLDLGYELNLCHYTIHKEETVLFAEVRD